MWNGRGGREGKRTISTIFPLSIHSSNRYLITANGSPFRLNGDTPWSIIVQLTYAQIDTYLTTRVAQGFNAIMFNAIEHQYSDQSPAYRDLDGNDPFSTMTNFNLPVDIYWKRVDYVVNRCLQLGICCIINPAYWGYNGGSEGWWTEINAESDADLQTYGQFLANRYTQPNIIWCFAGDWPGGGATDRNKQWNIVTGMRSVRTNYLITCHNARSDNDPYEQWNGYAGFNINTCYTNYTTVVAEAINYSYTRNMPFFYIEGTYEGDTTAVDSIRQAWQSQLCGSFGHMYGHTPMWNFGYGGATAASTLSTYLTTEGTNRLGVFNRFWNNYKWWQLVPKQDASLVSSSLSTGVNAVCPALSTDGKFAVIYKNDSSSTTVVMTNFTISSVRARWMDPLTGVYTTVSGSPFANTGSQVIAHPGNNSSGGTDWVLVFDEGQV